MTQGLLSIVDDQDRVIIKAVSGANGQDVGKAAKAIKAMKGQPGIVEVFKACQEAGMAVLIVMDHNGNVLGDEYAMEDVGPLPDLYYSKFGDPNFNPRWENGTAAYTEIIKITNQ